ncbi:DUF2512 family protein [Alkalibacterium sp. 20]|uniref:DUF2512 family protein n=1 Tax=Alkalibacterium sp. 20 TaxID=1798803 RepID=UPI00090044B8|nr:DUF2512 family protein [Alkalibacterium sp. 20]OJF93816.1 hypothetical protein AX762_08515 [Alkalibacterium sp. 20]
MRHVKALGIKLAVQLLWAWVFFHLIYSFTLSAAIIIAVTSAILLYLLSDWFILRKLGNLPATLMDILATLSVAWVFLNMSGSTGAFLPSLYFALGIGFYELIFHEYLTKSGIVPDERPSH